MTIKSDFKSVSRCVSYYRTVANFAVLGIIALAVLLNALPYVFFDYYSTLELEPIAVIFMLLFFVYLGFVDERSDNEQVYFHIKEIYQKCSPTLHSRLQALQQYVNQQGEVVGLRYPVKIHILDLPADEMDILITYRSFRYHLFLSESVLMKDESTLRAVVMHEIAHAKHHDLTLMTLSTWIGRLGIAGVVYGIYASMLELQWSILLMLPVLVLVAVLQMILYVVYSRCAEFAADAFVVKHSSYGMFLATFLRQLEALYTDVGDEDNIDDYDDLVDIALPRSRPIFDTHPLSENRIELVEKMISLKLKCKMVNI